MSGGQNFNWRALIGFELCWFALVFWQSLAMVPVLLYWLYGFWRLNRRERVAVLLIMLVGLALDSALVAAGVLSFSASPSLPLWFVLLWGVFALAAVEFMAKLLTKPWLAALLGGSGGPLSYWGGAALSGGVLQFPSPLYAVIVLVIAWALLAIALGQSRRFYVKAS
ncbi:DUF2878 domain-containing protein [Rheinheimera nanhaiensis]|uniref:DUF2878 domain-containing protein n=1 Tax=Rheinheimera nanhaiensis E407-8 TaxID=562729 RepID=I1DVK0_9GAMM|nr:DUF2878 domain-containing protein [Rheinheimera nanhaiensis]GAB58078.1 hypothetical protein RNAN_1049 [Rheinheimera nanhaiensis E407-8]